MTKRPETKGAGKPAPDRTRNKRQNDRQYKLNALARAAGWTGISEYMTAIINGHVAIVQIAPPVNETNP